MLSATDASFAEDVLGSDLPVLVDFWARWCPPCRMIAPVLAEIARERAGRLVVVTVNTDENPGVARDYQVMSLPTLLLFRGGGAGLVPRRCPPQDATARRPGRCHRLSHGALRWHHSCAIVVPWI